MRQRELWPVWNGVDCRAIQVKQQLKTDDSRGFNFHFPDHQKINTLTTAVSTPSQADFEHVIFYLKSNNNVITLYVSWQNSCLLSRPNIFFSESCARVFIVAAKHGPCHVQCLIIAGD